MFFLEYGLTKVLGSDPAGYSYCLEAEEAQAFDYP